MKYFKCWYDEDDREWQREEMTREETIEYLARDYKREYIPQMIAEPTEIRTMFGYVAIGEDE